MCRYIEIFKSSTQEAYTAVGQPRIRGLMSSVATRPGPYDRGDRFSGSGGGGMGNSGGNMSGGGGMGGNMGYGRGRGNRSMRGQCRRTWTYLEFKEFLGFVWF